MCAIRRQCSLVDSHTLLTRILPPFTSKQAVVTIRTARVKAKKSFRPQFYLSASLVLRTTSDCFPKQHLCIADIIFMLKTISHNTQSRIRYTTCFGLLSHDQSLIKDFKKTFNSAIRARSPTLCVVKHYEST